MKKQPKKKYLKFDQNEEKHINNFFQSLSFKKSLVTKPTKILKKTIYTILENQNIVFDEKNNITIISTEYTLFIVHLLYKQLTKDGFKVQIKTTLPESFSNHLHIVICPQIFDRLPDHYIAFQMEQLESSKWFNERYRKILKNAIAIFDYSIQNLKYLHKNNAFPYKQLFFLPISFFEGYQQFLIQEGYWNSCKADTCDVLFYGSTHSERRQNYLHALQNKFSVKIIDGIFGNDLYMELLSAKVVVNIHYYENALLETTRLYECLSLGLSVVSEESIDMEEHSELLEKIDFVHMGDIDQMISSIESILAKKNSHVYPDKNAIEKQKDMNKEDLIVSICVMSYNLEKYIEEALDSILMQKVNFRYNIIIGDDYSTDKTREILQKYATKYPNKIKLLLHESNIGMLANFAATLKKCEGKYIALLDGDDYWTDPLKLQKQVDFLESNKDYSMVFHNIELHDETKKGVVVKPFNLEEKSREYSYDEIARVWSVGTCSVLCINDEQYRYIEKNLWFPVQDLPFYLCCASMGNLYYMAETMSVYRRLLSGSQNSKQFKSLEHNLNFIEYLKVLHHDFSNLVSKETIGRESARHYLYAAYKCKGNDNMEDYWKYLALAMKHDPKFIYEKEIQAKQNNLKKIAEKEISQYKKTIEAKNKLIAQQKQTIKKQNKAIENTTAIQKVIQYSIIKHPIKKYKAYKKMLKTYDQVKASPEIMEDS